MEKGGILTRKNKLTRNKVSLRLTKEALDYMRNISKEYYLYRLYNEGEVVYVGKTSNLDNRIIAHKKDKEFDTYDYYLGFDSDVHLYEVYYINKHRPIYNKDCKGLSDMSMNTIEELEFIQGGNV